MEESKTINFFIYRYHLLPIISNSSQTSLFPENKLSLEDIKEQKNIFFAEELNILDNDKKSPHPLKLHFKEGNYYLFKIAQRKTTTITKNFQTSTIDNEPYSYVIINNDPKVQKIAISDNSEAFSNPDVIKNILKKIFIRDLEKHGLNIEIEQLFSAVNFWKYVDRHKDELTYLNFQFIKPNLANISSSLPDDFKAFAENVNSHESHIILKAPKKGRLENIDKNNSEINGLVDYASKGAGSIKLKVKKIRKTLNTDENPIVLQVEDLQIEGAAQQVVKVFKTIVE
jgi:hypothetical protein